MSITMPISTIKISVLTTPKTTPKIPPKTPPIPPPITTSTTTAITTAITSKITALAKDRLFAPRFKHIGLAAMLSSQFCLAALSPGDLIITELMANPSAVGDTHGEWFEIFNPGQQAITLNGLQIRDQGSNLYTVDDADASIAAGAYFIFGRSADQATNGGLNVDAVLTSFSLSNSSDAIIIEFDGVTIDSLTYSGITFGTAGNSAELTASGFALTDISLIYGDGDIGTPGSAGSFIPPQAVPVPAAGWLLITALASLTFAKQRSRR